MSCDYHGNASPVILINAQLVSVWLKVWMTIVESGWNVWVWLAGGGCG